MTKDEALKMALEALEYMDNHYISLPQVGMQAIAAIKEALAQPEQEYHAVNAVHKGEQCYVKTQTEQPKVRTGNCLRVGVCASEGHKIAPQRKPLTLGQKQRLWSSFGDKPTLKDRVNAYGLAIEAAHGIKGEA